MRPLRIVAIALALTLTACACGCARQPAPRGAAPKASASPDAQALSGAQAVNAFGFDLMRERLSAKAAATSNVVLSPLSVHAALSMTMQGARGQTAAEMQRTLHVADAPAAATSYTLLLDLLANRSEEQTLSVANAIWVRQGLDVKRQFLNANRIAFGSTIKTLDFDRTDMVGIVNRWVAEQTHGMITEIVRELDPRAVMLLANAVYFKASWAEPFESEATRPEAFHRSATDSVDVPMMHATDSLPVVQTGTYSATKLGYRGGDSAAYLILPAEGRTLDAVLSAMDAEDFAALRSHLDSQVPTRTALTLPRFDTTADAKLVRTLANMGMPTAFDPQRADFLSMATPPPGQNIWIGDVVHKARMKFDESGTEAAAATVVEMFAGAAPVRPQPRPFVFECDHPFAVAITDTQSGALLFLAAMRDPSQP
jgi:serine protease inhibitor